ncbi:SymE family type I addiction module toxin [Salmonella enterica subsp. enterica serovar Agona]|nr:SymE family type I addiction module toxin [Salmonella enterica subsp. enterica serovar Agona]
MPDFNHCEFYSRVVAHSVRLYGEWMPQAGFINGMPVKIRVMNRDLPFFSIALTDC